MNATLSYIRYPNKIQYTIKSTLMDRKKQKTTLLFVHKGPQNVKPVQISSKLILNWRKYILVATLFFFSLIGIIGYLVYYNIQQNKSQEILAQKLNTMHIMVAQVDSSAVRQKLSNIDKQLSNINGFLKARGIKTVYQDAQGGEEDSDVVSTEEIADFYEDYVNNISYSISHTPLGLPFRGPITSRFGARENPFGGTKIETHRGLDIKGPMGGQVKAMAKGEVEFAGQKSGFGNCIILKHGNGFETLYGHLSKILVRVGQQIDIGQQIGAIGSTGRSTGPHLHYEVRRYGQKINPQSFLTLN
ncbi:MAG TPA: M23 family metallopeptidase [Chitinophagaceae bacterium]|jgi:murein DD-endopeptidase MepM/ murein hydrolase activator NlpD